MLEYQFIFIPTATFDMDVGHLMVICEYFHLSFLYKILHMEKVVPFSEWQEIFAERMMQCIYPKVLNFINVVFTLVITLIVNTVQKDTKKPILQNPIA